jgi:hypothetical protein
MLLNLNTILKYDDKLYDMLFTTLDEKINEINENKLYIMALDFVNIHNSNINKYDYVVSQYNNYIKTNNIIGDKQYLINNFISFVNYNGSETYLTNGAFLDIVINQQMCANKDIINIKSPYLYFTSFIENMSDLLLHYHKIKYLDRAKSALDNLYNILEIFDIETYKIVTNKLDMIINMQKRCQDDILTCPVYKMMDVCIQVIIDISNIFYNYLLTEYKLEYIEESIIKFSRLQFPSTSDIISDETL